jgi:hypothetical protein
MWHTLTGAPDYRLNGLRPIRRPAIQIDQRGARLDRSTPNTPFDQPSVLSATQNRVLPSISIQTGCWRLGRTAPGPPSP